MLLLKLNFYQGIPTGGYCLIQVLSVNCIKILKMKTIFNFLLVMLCFTVAANAQTAKTLKKVMEFVMPGETGGQDGTRGASVAYNPVLKKYYAAFAGNIGYPMAVFNLKGEMISAEDLKARADLRGLWYNPISKTLQGNCYNDGGWVNYKIDAKGMPAEPTNIIDSMHQPDEQSVGTFDGKTKTVYFINNKSVVAYDFKGKEGKSVELIIKKEEGDEEDALPARYNNSTVIFTDIPKQEFGLFNTDAKKIELYNRATGKYSTSWILPEDAPINTTFNFAYCNGLVWLFDMDTRTWSAYK
jgi:hypothetical protein